MDWDEGYGLQYLQADAYIAGIVLSFEIGAQMKAVLAWLNLFGQPESQILEHLARGFYSGRHSCHYARFFAGWHLSGVKAII